MHEELKLDNQLCFRLYTASRLNTQAYTPLLNRLGITYPQYLVLMILWEKDVQSVTSIAHRLYLESNTMTPLLQRMEKQGLISRTRSQTDKRQQIVSLSEKGRLMEEQAMTVPLGLMKRIKGSRLTADVIDEMKHDLDIFIETLK